MEARPIAARVLPALPAVLEQCETQPKTDRTDEDDIHVDSPFQSVMVHPAYTNS